MSYALNSLIEILDQILNPAKHHKNWALDDDDDKEEIQTLLEKARSVKAFLENPLPTVSPADLDSLEDEIISKAEEVENALESHITELILSTDDDDDDQVNLSISSLGLSETFDDVEYQINLFKDAANQKPGDDGHVISHTPDSCQEFAVSLKSRNLLVGVDRQLMELEEQILGRMANFEVISIGGMGGIGKTTIAQALFDKPRMLQHFDICASVTISQIYEAQKVFRSLLACVNENSMHELESYELGEALHKTLSGKRYLILLDDLWSIEVWDDLRRFFPDNNKGSRIILTTRLSSVARNVSSRYHLMDLLNMDDSWELLKRMVFEKESCPLELEEIARQILKICQGLPLALKLVGGFLSRVERRKSLWVHLAEGLRSSINDESDGPILGTLSWIYFHLPHYLKPCFLYMASFPEDYHIQASKVIKLWVADGFLSPIPGRSMEQAAEQYLTDLVQRNLIFIRERKEAIKVRSFVMHDIVRDLGISIARKKRFLYWTTNRFKVDYVRDQRRVIVHSSDNDNIQVKLTSLVRSFQPIGLAEDKILSSLCFEFSLLRQLDLFATEFSEFPEEILKLVNLRYLAMRCANGLPDGISVLRNLQTLIFQFLGVGYFVLGIFDVPQIRHVNFKGSEVEMNPVDCCRSFALLENLQSLSSIPLEILKLLVGKIPNLIKLGTYGSGSYVNDDVVDLTCLGKLETLTCSYFVLSSNYIFPQLLRKLTLRKCNMVHLEAIGMLPHLEILKLEGSTLDSVEWCPVEGQFLLLKFLLLEYLNLVEWHAKSTHFPSLEQLIIRDCYELKEIPSDIGEIDTLRFLEVDDYSESVVESARRIQEEQLNFQNDCIQVRINNSSW